jgi:hypothetical protein
MHDRKIDIRDISYFIDHVKDIDLRISAIQQLGYSIGFDIASKDCAEKKIIKGKKGELRMQIEPKKDRFSLVHCAIIQ